MNITVIGHFCVDHFEFNGNPEPPDFPTEQFGGILHSVCALSVLAGSSDVIKPVFGVTAAMQERVEEFLSRFPNIDRSGIFRHKGKTNHVYIKRHDGVSHLIECSRDIAPPIPYSKIKSSLDADAILINMVSGSDITLEIRDYIRMETRDAGIPIHFDFHSLTLGVDGENKRFPRPLSDWRRWCFMMDSIQMTDLEAAGLTTENFSEETLINHLMSLMVSAFVITRGDAGATLIQQEIKKLTRYELQGVKVENPVNTIGCGDVFGAAFLYHYAKKTPLRETARLANLAAAAKTLIADVAQYHRLPELMDELDPTSAKKTEHRGSAPLPGSATIPMSGMEPGE